MSAPYEGSFCWRGLSNRKVVIMVTVLIVVMCVWMLVLTYFLTKLSKTSKVHELHLFEITSKVRGLKLAIKVLGARSYKEED